MTGTLARIATLVAALAFCAALPRVASATPGLDGCDQVLALDPGRNSVSVYTQGVFCLDSDIVVDADQAVTVVVIEHYGDVTIDCRGHLLEYRGNAQRATGIHSGSGERVTVRNCRFRGFSTSVDLTTDNLVEDNVIHASRDSMIGQGAIHVHGGTTIRRNRIFNSVGRAIAAGPGSVIEDNLIDGVTADGYADEAVGIHARGNASHVVRNTVRGLHRPVDNGSGQGHASGVFVDGADHLQPANIADNVFLHDASAGEARAVHCSGHARIADNIISGFALPSWTGQFENGCRDAGDNDVSP